MAKNEYENRVQRTEVHVNMPRNFSDLVQEMVGGGG
jgi:hypothetical protein